MEAFHRIWKKWRNLLVYGFILGMLIISLRLLRWKYMIADQSLEIFIGIVALFFMGLGVWIAMQLVKTKSKDSANTESVPDQELLSIDEIALKKLQLTKREKEVLGLIVKGYSNLEIAEALHLSVSTIKTHVSNLYSKLDVKRRGQAIDKARKLRIVK
ncbi:MAG: DNA-binding response regulator [Saprospirales bacterium]|nr:MAG: DNA-binding response regulator [Saprospirales bacterium]